MPFQIVVPELGESVLEATVGEWLKHEGEAVQAGEPIVKLETDKVDLEVAAERPGVLSHIDRQAGEDVQIGDVLGTIEEGGAAQSGGATAAREQTSSESTSAARQEVAAGRGEAAGEEKVTPVARRVAEDHGVDLSRVHGSGPQGKVTKQDVEDYLQQPGQGQPLPGQPHQGPPAAETRATPAAPVQPQQAPQQATRPAQPGAGAQALPQFVVGEPTAAPREERSRMSRRRQTIARRLVEAQHNAAMLTTFNEVDMGAVMDVRTRRRDSFKERHNVGLGFMSFFVKASIGALKSFPRLNAEIDGDDIILKRYFDIGIAVGAEEGLVVPVLRDADRMSFAEIERTIKDLARKANDGSLTLEDLRGGTFTITNGGVFGSLLSTPILNPPQVAILGLHKIEERPVAANGQVVIRPMMYVAVSYDHRIVDGREAVQFLVRIKELIEDPESLLLEG